MSLFSNRMPSHLKAQVEYVHDPVQEKRQPASYSSQFKADHMQKYTLAQLVMLYYTGSGNKSKD